jgi:hypothetical protein
MAGKCSIILQNMSATLTFENYKPMLYGKHISILGYASHWMHSRMRWELK